MPSLRMILARCTPTVWACANLRLRENLVVLGPAFNDRDVLVNSDLPGLTEIGNLYVFQLDVEPFSDGLPTREHGNLLQHNLALIPEAGCPDGRNLQRAPQFIHDEISQRLAPNILCDYEQRLATLCDLLKEWKQVVLRTDFLFVNENVDVLKGNFHAFGVSHEIR